MSRYGIFSLKQMKTTKYDEPASRASSRGESAFASSSDPGRLALDLKGEVPQEFGILQIEPVPGLDRYRLACQFLARSSACRKRAECPRRVVSRIAIFRLSSSDSGRAGQFVNFVAKTIPIANMSANAGQPRHDAIPRGPENAGATRPEGRDEAS